MMLQNLAVRGEDFQKEKGLFIGIEKPIIKTQIILVLFVWVVFFLFRNTLSLSWLNLLYFFLSAISLSLPFKNLFSVALIFIGKSVMV